MEEKTYVDDIDRSIYDIKNDEKDSYVAKNSDSDKKPEEKQDNK